MEALQVPSLGALPGSEPHHQESTTWPFLGAHHQRAHWQGLSLPLFTARCVSWPQSPLPLQTASSLSWCTLSSPLSLRLLPSLTAPLCTRHTVGAK